MNNYTDTTNSRFTSPQMYAEYWGVADTDPSESTIEKSRDGRGAIAQQQYHVGKKIVEFITEVEEVDEQATINRSYAQVEDDPYAHIPEVTAEAVDAACTHVPVNLRVKGLDVFLRESRDLLFNMVRGIDLDVRDGFTTYESTLEDLRHPRIPESRLIAGSLIAHRVTKTHADSRPISKGDLQQARQQFEQAARIYTKEASYWETSGQNPHKAHRANLNAHYVQTLAEHIQVLPYVWQALDSTNQA